MLKSLFVDHPHSVGESYEDHLVQAGRFGGRLILAGIACLVHAVLPFVFTRTASGTIMELHQRMVVNRAGRSADAHPARPPMEGSSAAL